MQLDGMPLHTSSHWPEVDLNNYYLKFAGIKEIFTIHAFIADHLDLLEIGANDIQIFSN